VTLTPAHPAVPVVILRRIAVVSTVKRGLSAGILLWITASTGRARQAGPAHAHPRLAGPACTRRARVLTLT
jgi:hypothetical protein